LFKAKVLKKIRTKAPVSDHALLRSFHRMSMAKLAKTVTELVEEGLVRRENGKLIVTERGQTKR
jgi:DNA-binding HxlR family transcriptional regulator